MKILVLNGSPHPGGNTKALIEAFYKGAKITLDSRDRFFISTYFPLLGSNRNS